jgi:hypothetical protein
MYTAKNIFSGIRDPKKIGLELNRIYNRKIRGQTGIKVMEEDWDNLIILDACRYDLFEQVNTIEGELRPVISSDSSTSGFLQYNFGDDTFPDTVYVSANPQVQRHGVGKHFYDCIRLWEDYWDKDLQTVVPKDVTDCTLEVQDKYPNKRLLIHYIQPHYPFIGEVGRQIEHGSVTGDGVIGQEREFASVWDQLEAGVINKDRVWEAYKENLELVLPEVERLIDYLTGRSVVTSDHGNTLGELGVYGHPGGVFLEPLVKVPWLITDRESRKKVEKGEIRNENRDIEGNVANRLADLGYVE